MAGTEGSPTVARSWPRGRELAVIAAVVLVYLALVAFQIRLHQREDYDEYIFMDVGRQILATGLPYRTFDFPAPSLFFDHTPLYVYLVAAITFLGGHSLALVRFATLAFGVLTVIATYVVGRTVRGPVAGVVGALVLATNPFFATYSWFVRMEVPLSCFLVLSVLALHRRRNLLGGVLIAVAVMLKEIALAFWLVAIVFTLVRRGVRAALAVGTPSVIALSAWFAYAAALGSGQLDAVFQRWFTSAAGGNSDPRLKIRSLAWLETIVQRIVGPTGLLATGAAATLAALEPRGIPAIIALPLGYIAVATLSSFAIALKEPRYLIAVVPMLAIAIALVADWDGYVATARFRWADLRRGQRA